MKILLTLVPLLIVFIFIIALSDLSVMEILIYSMTAIIDCAIIIVQAMGFIDIKLVYILICVIIVQLVTFLQYLIRTGILHFLYKHYVHKEDLPEWKLKLKEKTNEKI